MTRLKLFFKELWLFGLKQIEACVFAGSFLALLLISNFYSFGLPRYDFLFIGAVLIQLILVLTKLETKDELKVITIFHLIGLALELFKTNPEIGSWSYPEEAFFKLGTVPLYSGFMYSSVASYIIQSWRTLNLRLENYPPYFLSVPISILAYLNFFTHHYIPDLRYVLIFLTVVVFWKTRVYFTVIKNRERWMPLLLAFLLIAFFIWIAENLGTLFNGWEYVYQKDGWTVVDLGKISSWLLLFILSFIIVADLKYYKEVREGDYGGSKL